jgi:hypothetical protein
LPRAGQARRGRRLPGDGENLSRRQSFSRWHLAGALPRRPPQRERRHRPRRHDRRRCRCGERRDAGSDSVLREIFEGRRRYAFESDHVA